MPPQVNIKVTADTKQAQQNLSGFSKSFTELNSKLQLVQQAAGIFSDTIEKAFDMGREGAQVIQTAESFDLLLDKIGAAPDLFDKLKKAGGGTISEMKMMSSTATLLAGASGDLATSLANATPQLLEIARAANKLNPSLGDTTFLYDSLATGVKRASPMILDNLGLTIKVGEANEKYARQLGKATTALTAEEQKQALLNATLEAGQVLIEQVGGNVDSATDSFTRMDASIENATNALKSKLAPAISNAANAIYYILAGQNMLNDAFDEARAKASATAKSYDEYVDEMLRIAVVKGQLIEGDKEYLAQALKTGDATEYLAHITGMTADQIEELGYDTGLTNEEVKALASEMGVLSKNQFAVANAAKQAGSAQEWYAMRAQEAIQKTNELSKASETLALTEDELKVQQEKLNAKLQDLQYFMSGPVGDEVDKFREKNAKLREEASALEREIVILESKTWLSRKQKEELAGMQAELENVNEAIRGNADEHDRATKRIMLDLLMQRAAVDGLSEQELQLINDTAYSWGLIDQETREMTEGIDKALTDLAEGKGVNQVKGELDKLRTRIEEVPRIINIDFWLRTHGEIPSLSGSGGGAEQDISEPGGGETPVVYNDDGEVVEGGMRASGGSVYSGSSYLVGELGPEIFTPSQSGVITPNSALDLAPVVAAVVALGYKFDNFSRQLPKDVAAAVAVVV